MAAANPAQMPHQESKVAFFRQSSWLMFAGIASGALTWAVHLLARKIPEAAYADFGTLLALTACVPTMPLQMVLSQQTAAGLATNRERVVAGMIRQAWLWTFLIWVLFAVAALVFQHQIAVYWKLSDVHSLWVTLPILLFASWVPLFSGVLQGQQNFLWLGWALIHSGLGRLVIAGLLVVFLAGGATGMMIGVLVGMVIGVGICVWQSRHLLFLPSEPFDKRTLLIQMLPLALGFGACQFMFSSDTMFSKGYFSPDEMACYVAAGTLSRALLWVVLPLAVVMFPKIVHSTARLEKSNLHGIVLLGTAVLGICGVAGLWVLGPWVIRIVYPAKYVSATMALLPWYAGAMVPLALANVMINDLMARGSYRVVPALIVVAVGYAVALTRFHDTPVMVLKTLGVFNFLLLAVCALFTWGVKQSAPATADRR